MTRPLRILVAQNVPHNLRGGMTRMLGFIHDRAAVGRRAVPLSGQTDPFADYGHVLLEPAG